MGLSKTNVRRLKAVIGALETPKGCIPWAAMPALAAFGGEGWRLEIDVPASRSIGATVILTAPTHPCDLPHLTRRQRDVASRIAKGQSNKTIAKELGIAVSTVKDHVHAILDRTGLGSRAELIVRMRG